jgi:hypothetical protein
MLSDDMAADAMSNLKAQAASLQARCHELEEALAQSHDQYIAMLQQQVSSTRS